MGESQNWYREEPSGLGVREFDSAVQEVKLATTLDPSDP